MGVKTISIDNIPVEIIGGIYYVLEKGENIFVTIS